MIKLIKATPKDAKRLHEMQREAFADLLAVYQDHDYSPANESVQRITEKLQQTHTYFYFIVADGTTVGAIRVIDAKDGSLKRISPLFIMKQYRNKGYAQAAISTVEAIHGANNWSLGTILQEPGNCHLYEKMGYRQTGHTKIINPRMTIVDYQKD